MLVAPRMNAYATKTPYLYNPPFVPVLDEVKIVCYSFHVFHFMHRLRYKCKRARPIKKIASSKLEENIRQASCVDEAYLLR